MILKYFSDQINFLKKLTRVEWIFFLLSTFMCWGYIQFDVREVRFAKIGIPLHFSQNTSADALNTKYLYITEIYLFLISLLLIFSKNKLPGFKKFLSNKRSLLLWLVFIFLFYGLFRAAFDIKAALMLVLRNSCFVWYLFLPLFVFFLPLRKEALTLIFTLIQAYAFVIFTIALLLEIPKEAAHIFWIPCLGLMGPLAFALLTKTRLPALLILTPIAVALAGSYRQGIQRTVLLGLILTWIFLFVSRKKERVRLLKRTAFLFLFFLFSLKIIFPFSEQKELYSFQYLSKNSLIKSEADASGLEYFRKQMWLDAAEIFVKNPLIGIGFQKQVVYRIYHNTVDGVMSFYVNDGRLGTDDLPNQRPPISGPHNSYLNAFARMGILGGLILLIHGLSLLALWRAQSWAGFYLLAGQMLYAAFNVGLEGPSRSFFSLLCIGLALKLTFETYSRNSSAQNIAENLPNSQ